jgi:hypothetical protein
LDAAESNYVGRNSQRLSVAAIGSSAAAWYGVLGKAVDGCARMEPSADVAGPDGKRRMPVGPMISSRSSAALIMGVPAVGGCMRSHQGAATGEDGAIISGALVWVGFVITTIAVQTKRVQRAQW